MRRRQFHGGERLEERRLLAVSIANLPAKDVTFDSATIGVEILEFGAFEPTISLFWGTTDGGTDFGAWENRESMGELGLGQHEITVSNLDVNAPYYYRASAFSFDGVGWAPETTSFTTLAPQPVTLSSHPVLFTGGTNARVGGRIESTGGHVPTVSIFYGTSDGGAQPDQWESTVPLGEQADEFQIDIDSLVPDQRYFFRFAATNAAGTSWSTTDSLRTRVVPPLQISEFSAAAPTSEDIAPAAETFGTRIRSDAENTFAGDQIVYDWLEIENNTIQTIDVSRFSLSDNADDVSKWTFPAGASIPPLSSIVVFASGLDIKDSALDENGSFHTSFRLAAEGGFLGLFDPSGMLVHQVAERYPVQMSNISYGYFGDGFQYMEETTPGRANAPGMVGLTSTPTFSQRSGSFTEDFDVVILADDEGAEIRYTLDGSAPSEESLLYQGAIRVSDSVRIRARSFRPGHVASEISAANYLKISDEASSFRSHLPIVVVDNFDGRRPSARQVDAFMAIFDVSPETKESSLLTAPHVASRIGIKVRGQSSSGDIKTPYRVETRDEHGRDLDIAPLGLPADADWVLHGPWSDRTLVHNSISYELGPEIGLTAPRTRYVELFRNLNGGAISDGDYLGLYLLVESIKRSPDRVDVPDLDPGQVSPDEITGGYILRFEQEVSEPRDRLDRWQHLELFDGQKYSPEQKSWITDYVNRADSAIERAESNRDYEQYIDVDSFVNTLVMHELGRDQDAYVRSFYLHKDRGGKLVAGPLWDFNLIWNRGCCFDNRNPRGWQFDQDRPGRDDGWNKGEHNWNGKLMESWDFSQRFIDRWTHLRQDGNLLSLENLMARVDRHVSEIGDAATRNFDRFSTLLTNSSGFPGPRFPTYQEHIDDMKNWIATRLEWIDGRFRTPPLIEEFNGKFRLSGGEGTIYYTLDGSDPFNNMTGEPSGTAIAYDGTDISVEDGARIIARLHDPTILPRRTELTKTQWSAPASSVMSDAVPADSHNLRISEIHYHPHVALPQFGELDVDDDEFEFVEVTNIGSEMVDLSGVRFVETGQGQETSGITFHFAPQTLQPGEARIIVSNREAFLSRHPNSGAFAMGNDGIGNMDGQYGGRLSNGGDVITLLNGQGTEIHSLSYSDADGWPARADGSGSSLEMIDLFGPQGDLTNWQASQQWEGSPGVETPPRIHDVVINEILSNSNNPNVDQIELLNVGGSVVDLDQWYVSDSGRNLFKFQIAGEQTTLDSGAYFVFDETTLGFGFKGQENDDAWLIASNSTGYPIRFADHVEFGASSADVSLGRWPNGQGPLIPMRSFTFGQDNSGPLGVQDGDLDGDGVSDSNDIEFLCQAMIDNDSIADLNVDGMVDFSDLRILVQDRLQLQFGDVNFDGQFNATDLLAVFQAGEYEDAMERNSVWTEGDWNCDSEFTSRDMVLAFQMVRTTLAANSEPNDIAAYLNSQIPLRAFEKNKFDRGEKMHERRIRDNQRMATDAVHAGASTELFGLDSFEESWAKSISSKKTINHDDFSMSNSLPMKEILDS